MASRIRYMGNKRHLAPIVASLIADLRPARPLLDLFSGMCFVAGAVADSGRQVWVNDVQRYAELAGRCLVGSASNPPDATRLADLTRDFNRNEGRLLKRFAEQLELEQRVLAAPTVSAYSAAYRSWQHAGNSVTLAEEVAEARRSRRGPHRLCTLTFAWGYFGLRQSIALDSMRYAIDLGRRNGTLDPDEALWLRLALIQAASRIATGPGHLSQYLKGETEASLARIIALRHRDVVEQVGVELSLLEPFGSQAWRTGNRVTRGDALQLWPRLKAQGFRNAVVYADPPYTKNEYSRFYHVLETLVRYDYPPSLGSGRYRPDRFHTALCSRTGVLKAFHQLVRGVASTGSHLVLSYPARGLLNVTTGASPEAVLRTHFRDVGVVWRSDARHSTLGARHGHAALEAEELVYLATSPR